ncbi:MAG TPA: peptidoglycan DD-metalloendopeptidase family protein [Parcubacteria group bacterium]|jgi:murein DD-endopeptidase MepM/ murein hydrolase activator NlpD|nr:peptidoglycan DD-metalloendopeptidase family protein [Parcubacteria group bacterium]
MMQYQKYKTYINKYGWVFLLLIFFSVTNIAHTQTITNPDELKNKIDDRQAQIKKLEEEIKQFNAEVENANKEAKTLETTIKSLDLTKKKITTDINLTENKISKTNLTIQQIGGEISTKEEQIENNRKAVTNAIKNAQFIDNNNIITMILTTKSISDVWKDIDNIQTIREAIRDKTKELSGLKRELEVKQEDLSEQKEELVDLKQDLSGKKQAVEYTVKEKATVLTQTKSKEQAFKELVKTKEQQRTQYLKELFEYESQLKYLIDPNSYPQGKPSILAWPLDNVYITQRFGKTVGAQKLYTSGSHNGVDFRATVGTRVKNVLTGTVVGSGNTDQYPGCYSFGKWVMVRHDNGLSTIYAHLSVISVNNGQKLETGDTIGFSGNTGYSTGPHLHISVYATQGVRIEKFVNSRGCKEAVIPLADIRAYLDPMEYFPAI